MNRQQRRADAKNGEKPLNRAEPPKTLAVFANAVAHHQDGRLSDAEPLYRQILAIDPNHIDAIYNLGLLNVQTGRHEIGGHMFARAIALNDQQSMFHSRLGDAMWAQGRLAEAEAAYRGALKLKADIPEVHCNLGVVLKAQGKVEDAIASYRQALTLKPDYAEAHSNLGNALTDQGALTKALAAFTQALKIAPNFAQAHHNLGKALKDQGRLDEAIQCYERALDLKPDAGETHSNLLMTQQYDSRIANAEIFAAARRFGALFDGKNPKRFYPNDRSPGRRLRIGYVSGDFGQHPVGFLLMRVFENHDRQAVEIFCYANQTKADAMTRRLRATLIADADHWRPIRDLSDSEAAKLIARDGIDLLIDLSGHTANNRLMLFALRPAPIQASWLGYFGTTGLAAMDYLVMDETTVPSGEEHLYSEAVVRLPYGRFCYAPPDYAPAPADPPSLRRDLVTFGSFNNIVKIRPDVVRLWAQVLRATPKSRLVLKCRFLDDDDERRRLRDAFYAAGVLAEQLEIRGSSPHVQMLAEYGDIDIALDPFPFGGGLTSCEALWMGVPIVTLTGDRPVSRQTKGFLDHVGLSDCVAHSTDDYVRRATALANDPERRTALRHALRSRMGGSPLCNGKVFTPTIEAAFRHMWARWCAGERAAAFNI